MFYVYVLWTFNVRFTPYHGYVIEWLEFELGFFLAAVKYFSYYATGITLLSNDKPQKLEDQFISLFIDISLIECNVNIPPFKA